MRKYTKDNCPKIVRIYPDHLAELIWVSDGSKSEFGNYNFINSSIDYFNFDNKIKECFKNYKLYYEKVENKLFDNTIRLEEKNQLQKYQKELELKLINWFKQQKWTTRVEKQLNIF